MASLIDKADEMLMDNKQPPCGVKRYSYTEVDWEGGDLVELDGRRIPDSGDTILVLAGDYSDALEAELETVERECHREHDKNVGLTDRVHALEAALREIAGGLMLVDSVADHHNRYELCAGRLCKIARDALR